MDGASFFTMRCCQFCLWPKAAVHSIIISGGRVENACSLAACLFAKMTPYSHCVECIKKPLLRTFAKAAAVFVRERNFRKSTRNAYVRFSSSASLTLFGWLYRRCRSTRECRRVAIRRHSTHEPRSFEFFISIEATLLHCHAKILQNCN